MLPARISPIIIAASQAGAGTRVNSTTATMTQTGTITARWRRIVLSRQPASVSSCLTQSRLSSGSRNPSANSSHRSGPGSPGILVIVLSSRIAGPRGTRSVRDAADGLAGRDGLAYADAQFGDGAALVRGQRLLHLHRLEHHDGLALVHALTFGGNDLDDGALHRAGEHAAVGSCAGAGPATAARPVPARPVPARPVPARPVPARPSGTRSARTGGAARTGRGPGARRARHPQAEPGGDGHLEALAADLDHDPLPPGHRVTAMTAVSAVAGVRRQLPGELG